MGNTVEVYGRRFKIVEFGDQITKDQLFLKKERTFSMIKPDAYTSIGKIIDIIQSTGFQINKIQMLKLNEEMVTMLYPDLSKKAYFREMLRFLCSDVVVGMEVIGENSIERMKQIVGPTNPTQAK